MFFNICWVDLDPIRESPGASFLICWNIWDSPWRDMGGFRRSHRCNVQPLLNMVSCAWNCIESVANWLPRTIVSQAGKSHQKTPKYMHVLAMEPSTSNQLNKLCTPLLSSREFGICLANLCGNSGQQSKKSDMFLNPNLLINDFQSS